MTYCQAYYSINDDTDGCGCHLSCDLPSGHDGLHRYGSLLWTHAG